MNEYPHGWEYAETSTEDHADCTCALDHEDDTRERSKAQEAF